MYAKMCEVVEVEFCFVSFKNLFEVESSRQRYMCANDIVERIESVQSYVL